jgi:hypothetical protein
MKKIWLAITAHKPLERINTLVNVLNTYSKYPYDITVKIYIDYDSQNDQEQLETVLEAFTSLKTEVIVASPGYEGWYLTWAHKNDLATAVLRKEANFYIYQENDMIIPVESFHYWLRWKQPLARYNLEPGFIRYENFKGKKVPFDNYQKYSLTKETKNVWHDIGFKVPKILVISHDFDLFVQVANPYYGAMILDQTDADKYIRSQSFDPHKSYELVGVRNWPIADRSSMGLAFEDLPAGHEHRRCVPIKKVKEVYQPHPWCLLQHDDTKYAPELYTKLGGVLDCKEMFEL